MLKYRTIFLCIGSILLRISFARDCHCVTKRAPTILGSANDLPEKE